MPSLVSREVGCCGWFNGGVGVGGALLGRRWCSGGVGVGGPLLGAGAYIANMLELEETSSPGNKLPSCG